MKTTNTPIINLLYVATVLAANPVLSAADFTWGGGNGLWTDASATGWNGGVPASGDNATIGSGTVTATANNQQQGVNLAIGAAGTLSSGNNYLYFSGGTLVLDSGTILINPAPGEPWGSAALGATVVANSGVSAITGSQGAQLCLESGGSTFTGPGDLDVAIALRDYFYSSAGVTKSGTGTVTLGRANIYTGNTYVDGGSIHLAASGSLKFKLTGLSSNTVTGSGGLTLDGALVIDTAAADMTNGKTWNLIDVDSLAEEFGSTFSVAGFTEGSSGVWTKQEGAKTWTFVEESGDLSLAINPNYSTYVFSTRGPSPAGEVQTTWIVNGSAEPPTGPGDATNHRLNDWGIVDANNRVLMAFDLSRIAADAAGRGIRVSYAKLAIARSPWVPAGAWASNTLFTTAPFNPAAAIWENSTGLQETYIGDIGGGGPITMTWDSRYPGTNPWDENFDLLAGDVQDDLDNHRTANYLLRVNTGNEWSATIGADDFRLTVEVEFLPATPFSSWMAGFASIPVADRDPGDDPDADGASNLAEFALKGNPADGTDNGQSAGLLQDTTAPAGNELTLVVAVRDGAVFGSGAGGVQQATVAADNLTYVIEGSLDIGFPSSAVSHVSVADTATGLPDLTGTPWEYHTFRLDATEGLPGKGFLRVKVASP